VMPENKGRPGVVAGLRPGLSTGCMSAGTGATLNRLGAVASVERVSRDPLSGLEP
jgi:hypothetical protein